METCKIKDCENKRAAKGLCNKHYQRVIRNLPMDFKRKTLEERFFDKVNKKDSCWIWKGALSGGNKNGKCQYGYFNVAGKAKRAHRVSYELYHDVELKPDEILLHECDNPLCVNPEHLKIGTYYDNNHDTINKNRIYHPTGENNNSKLKEKDVLLIRNKSEKGSTNPELANEFNVSITTIRNIVIRKKWKHI